MEIFGESNATAYLSRCLDNLHEGEVREVEVMVSRRWDNATPQYDCLSTEYLFSDLLGNIVQCTVLLNRPLSLTPQLSDGDVYHVRDVLVTRNQDTHRVCKKNECALLFLDNTTVTELHVDITDFIRDPFDFVEFEDIEYVNHDYLIDVVGYVHSVGNMGKLPGSCMCLDFTLINTRGKLLEVKLWGRLTQDFLKTRHHAPKKDAFIFAGMSVEQSDGAIYLIGSMDTIVYAESELDDCEPLTIALSPWTR